MQFLINHTWAFNTEKRELYNHFLAVQYKLSSLHARCLESLCLAQLGTSGLATKKQLFYDGWEKYGLISSSNSLAQTIFQLRKVLKSLAVQGEILTIPRVGFKLINVVIEKQPLVSRTQTPLVSNQASFWNRFQHWVSGYFNFVPCKRLKLNAGTLVAHLHLSIALNLALLFCSHFLSKTKTII